MSRHVYEDALRQAGAKFNSRAAARGSGARKQAVQSAVQNREPLRPFMAAVGVKEDELLRHVFDTFRAQAVAEFDIYRAQVAAVVGDRAPVPSPADVAHAVDYLVAGLTTMVRARLLDGEQATLAAAAPKMLPKRGRMPDGGFDLPHGLPNPDELSQAAMRLVRNAVNVSEGRSTWIPGATPDRMPELAVVDDAPPMPEEALADEAGVQPLWTWVHGFYGEPMTEFDGHINLDGFQTYERSSADEPGDPDLASQGDWPAYDWYFPADHDSCSCEWIVEDVATPEQPVEQTPAPVQAPRIQSTRDVLEQARARVDGETVAAPELRDAEPLQWDDTTTQAQLTSYGREVFSGDRFTDLPLDQQAATGDYINFGSFPINTYLREGDLVSSAYPEQRIQEAVGLLDRAVTAGMADRDVVVFRYVDADIADEFQVGSVITDAGYVSTSLSPYAVEEEGETMLQIVVPAGSHGQFIGGYESEAILPRGSQFRVVDRQGQTIRMVLAH